MNSHSLSSHRSFDTHSTRNSSHTRFLFSYDITHNYTFATYSNGSGTIFPGVSISMSCSNVAFTIAVCISTSFGAPAFAPIGTSGATARGVPA